MPPTLILLLLEFIGSFLRNYITCSLGFFPLWMNKLTDLIFFSPLHYEMNIELPLFRFHDVMVKTAVCKTVFWNRITTVLFQVSYQERLAKSSLTVLHYFSF